MNKSNCSGCCWGVGIDWLVIDEPLPSSWKRPCVKFRMDPEANLTDHWRNDKYDVVGDLEMRWLRTSQSPYILWMIKNLTTLLGWQAGWNSPWWGWEWVPYGTDPGKQRLDLVRTSHNLKKLSPEDEWKLGCLNPLGMTPIFCIASTCPKFEEIQKKPLRLVVGVASDA